MAIYIVTALFLFVGVVSKQYKEGLYKLSLVLLFFITAFRDPGLGGTDAIHYQAFYQAVPKVGELEGYSSPYKIGYTLLNAGVKAFSNNYITFQIVYAFIVTVLVYLVIKEFEFGKSEKNLFLFSYFCYRYIWSTWITLRQNLATLIFWLLIIKLYKAILERKNNLQEKKKPKTLRIFFLFIVTIFLPAAFHSSAYINVALIPILLLLEKVDDKYKLEGVPPTAVFLFLFGGKIFGVLSRIMVSIDSRYEMYLVKEDGSSNIINFIFRLAFFCIYCYNIKNQKYQYKQLLVNALTVMVLLGSINNELMLRAYEYYAIGLYASMALFFHNFKKTSRGLAVWLFAFGMIIILVRFLYTMDGGTFLQYRFFN